MQQTTKEVFDHYLRQINESVAGAHKIICPAHGIALEPKSFQEIKPIPVYEGEPSLLTIANIRRPTKISWPKIPEPNFLQAYIKKYKDPDNGRTCNEIVVNVQANYCWARFYAAKELMHCMMDEDGYGASNSIQLVNDLIEELVSDDREFLDDAMPQTIVDEIAWLGAVLFVMPDSWLPQVKKLHEGIAAKFPDANADLHIAQIIRVPERVVRTRLRHAGSA